MKYIKLFENHSNYEDFVEGGTMEKPNVSHCVEENDVHYNSLIDKELIVKYNVIDASEPTKLYDYYEEEGIEEMWVTAALLFDKVEIDGTEVSITDLDTAQGTYQLSSGEHTVKYTLKDNTSIKNGAFWGVDSMSNVFIPNTVTSIGFSAFNRCSSLTSVTIPNSVVSIADYAFCECFNLNEESRATISAINPKGAECQGIS